MNFRTKRLLKAINSGFYSDGFGEPMEIVSNMDPHRDQSVSSVAFGPIQNLILRSLTTSPDIRPSSPITILCQTVSNFHELNFKHLVFSISSLCTIMTCTLCVDCYLNHKHQARLCSKFCLLRLEAVCSSIFFRVGLKTYIFYCWKADFANVRLHL